MYKYLGFWLICGLNLVKLWICNNLQFEGCWSWLYIMWFGLWRSPVLVLQVCLSPGGELTLVNLADGCLVGCSDETWWSLYLERLSLLAALDSDFWIAVYLWFRFGRTWYERQLANVLVSLISMFRIPIRSFLYYYCCSSVTCIHGLYTVSKDLLALVDRHLGWDVVLVRYIFERGEKGIHGLYTVSAN